MTDNPTAPGPQGSVSISGSGRLAGGQYENVSISGSGRVEGDLQARRLSVSGAGRVDGSVQAQEVRMSGFCRVAGDLQAGNLAVSGSGRVSGHVHATEALCSGSMEVGQDIHATRLVVAGRCQVGGGVEAEQFDVDGMFDIAGRVNADRMDIRLLGDCHAGDLGGSRIVVGLARGGGTLRTGSVEAEQVHLEHTHARCVRGGEVEIGRGCRIETVEYAQSLRIDPRAHVGQTLYTGQATPPPAPLREPVAPAGEPGGDVESVSVRRHGRGGYSVSPGRVVIGGREVRNPLARAVTMAAGLAIAVLVVGFVMLLVVPILVLTMLMVVLAVPLALLAALVGLPVVRVLSLMAEGLRTIARLPGRALEGVLGRRR